MLRLDTSSDIHSLDPTTIYSAFEGIVGYMVYRSLLDFDQNENLIPMLAETLPRIPVDRLTYTFPLRHGVRFSSGREVVADDWVYSIGRHLDSAASKDGGVRGFVDGRDVCLLTRYNSRSSRLGDRP